MNKRLLSFLLIAVVVATGAILWRNWRTPVIRLDDCTGIADLLPYNGKEVVLEGGLNLGFETNVMFPRRLLHADSGPRDLVLWVDLANAGGFSELWDWLKARAGDVRVQGVLSVSGKQEFGHFGMCYGRIDNAEVTLRPAQSLSALALGVLLLIAVIMFAARPSRGNRAA